MKLRFHKYRGHCTYLQQRSFNISLYLILKLKLLVYNVLDKITCLQFLIIRCFMFNQIFLSIRYNELMSLDDNHYQLYKQL